MGNEGVALRILRGLARLASQSTNGPLPGSAKDQRHPACDAKFPRRDSPQTIRTAILDALLEAGPATPSRRVNEVQDPTCSYSRGVV
jgi:hypothetical protein